MGFLKKLKGAVSKITGGGAKVTVFVNGNDIRETLNITVNVEVKESPLKVQKVYLWVKSVEKIDIPKNSLPQYLKEEANLGLKLSTDRFPRKEFIVSEVQTLEAKQSYTWSVDIKLEDKTPSYNGHFANHEWLFYAGLDVKGNDPDSGWQKFDLK
ncbi:MAG: hypothetical protein GXO80_05375 [Chlorobi bacterium]|nr:hypothetical protein [Chlorobiota bacterium]